MSFPVFSLEEFRTRFVFVPRGEAAPTTELAGSGEWIRLPATLRSDPQNEPLADPTHASDADSSASAGQEHRQDEADAAPGGSSFMADPIAAYRQADAAFGAMAAGGAPGRDTSSGGGEQATPVDAAGTDQA